MSGGLNWFDWVNIVGGGKHEGEDEEGVGEGGGEVEGGGDEEGVELWLGLGARRDEAAEEEGAQGGGEEQGELGVRYLDN